jgi:hypothetical protein
MARKAASAESSADDAVAGNADERNAVAAKDNKKAEGAEPEGLARASASNVATIAPTHDGRERDKAGGEGQTQVGGTLHAQVQRPAPVQQRAATRAAVAQSTTEVLRGGGPPPGYEASLRARARNVVAGLLGSHEFTLNVTVEPSTAASLDQVRRIRVRIVLPGASSETAAAVRRDLIRIIPLNPSRGDEVVIDR